MADYLQDNERHPKWKKFLYAAAFICLMLAGFLMVFSMRSNAATQKQSDFSDPATVQVTYM